MQAKLLKALEEQKVRRIGGREDIRFDVRIVCASNEDPEALVEQGRLRSDFYYRIGVVRLRPAPAAGAAGGYPAPDGALHQIF